MLFTHEIGHVVAAKITGGQITELELRPGVLSHTLVQPNPRPSIVLWSGFLSGWVLPLLTFPLWRIERGLIGPAVRLWAGFCLLVGGVYLAIGGAERFTDTGQLAAIGWPLWMLVLIGGAVGALGYWWLRRAWQALLKTICRSGVSWRAAIGWIAFAAGWCVAQQVLFAFLKLTA